MVSEEHIVTNTNIIENKEYLEESVQILNTWFSPSFPIGAYSFSHGLEAMIEDKLIQNKLDILNYIKSQLFYGTCKNDIIFIKFTYLHQDLNEFALSICPSKERKIETIELGNAFRKVILESWNFEIPINTAYPVAVGKAAYFYKLPLGLTMVAYLQSFVSNLVNICIKHIPLGQKLGQDCIFSSLKYIREIVKKSKNYTLDDLGGICFNSDVYSIKHEKLKTRIYKT